MKHLFATILLALATLAAQAQVEAGRTYRITSRKFPRKSLLIKDSSRDANADIVLWTETDVPSQQWTLRQIGDENFTFQNVYSSYFAATRSQTAGTSLWTQRAQTNGRFRLEPVEGVQNAYRILSNNGQLCLAVATGEDGEKPAWAVPQEADLTQHWFLRETEPKPAFDAAIRDEMMDLYLKAFCTSQGTGLRTFSRGGWSEAEQLEVVLDAYECTGNESYLNTAKYVYAFFNQNVGENWDRLVMNGTYNWFGHDFNDDVMWQIIAVARLGWLTGNEAYTEAARKNFDKIYDRAFMADLGLMRWAEQSGDRNGANSCVNGPTEVAACYLGMSGAGEEYFEKARDLYAAQRYRLANMNTGQVYDSFVWDPATQSVKSKNEWSSTYNQGTMLGAAVLLYDHYGDEQYLKDAQKIMKYTKSNLCNSYGVVKVCQNTDGDLCGFKGILMRYVRRFILDLGQGEYQDWMARNALHAYCNRTEKGITSSAWLTKSTAETATNAFSCSTAAAAAVNTPLGEVVKNGLDTLQAEAFDYHRGLVVTADQSAGAGRVVAVANGYWAQYDNVDFGDQTVRSMAIAVTAPTGGATGTVEVYFDRIGGTPAGVFELKDLEAGATWHTLLTDITPATGRHHVFLRFTTTATRAKVFRADAFRFFTATADDVRTGVGDVQARTLPSAPTFFDLTGRRLPGSPQQGAFIVRQDHRARVIIN